MILRRFDPLSCSLKRVHASMNMLFLMNKTKDKISRVSSHDLYWENKMYKRKRSIGRKVRHRKSRISLVLEGQNCEISLLVHTMSEVMSSSCCRFSGTKFPSTVWSACDWDIISPDYRLLCETQLLRIRNTN